MGKLFSSSIFYLALAFAFAATVECRNGFLSHLKEEILEEMRQGDASQACPYGDKCDYYVDDGCHSEKNGPDDVEGFYQSQDSTAFVRCCKEGRKGLKCDTISDCKNTTNLVTYGVAAELCTNKGEGWGLCTKAELKSDICCKTGGACDSFAVWTSTWEQKSDDDATDVPDWCPSGFTAISENLDGEGEWWVPPSLLVDQPIESACASACSGYEFEFGKKCTGFEFGPVQSVWGQYQTIGEYACATFSGGDSNISNGAGRLKPDSPWRSCIKPY